MAKAGTHRDAAEWRAIVAAWRQSGESARSFGTKRGISPRTLSWWAWRLRQDAAVEGDRDAGLRLVAVEPAADSGTGIAETSSWALNVEKDGATFALRVQGAIEISALRVVLAAITSKGRR